jgi:hypothetical protein
MDELVLPSSLVCGAGAMNRLGVDAWTIELSSFSIDLLLDCVVSAQCLFPKNICC